MSFLDIEKFIHENEIDTIEIGFGDINGVLRGKSIPARYFLKNIHQGFEFSNAPFVWDIQCDVYDELEEEDLSGDLSDIIAMPILSTLKKVPWRENTEEQSYVKRATLVPLSLEESLNLFENSRIASEYFGGRFVKLYTTLGRHEVELFRGEITEWERTRYLETV